MKLSQTKMEAHKYPKVNNTPNKEFFLQQLLSSLEKSKIEFQG